MTLPQRNYINKIKKLDWLDIIMCVMISMMIAHPMGRGDITRTIIIYIIFLTSLMYIVAE